MKTIAITGSTGFIGRRLVIYNSAKYRQQILLLRETKVDTINIKGVDAILHLAGKAHDMGLVDDKIYFDINYDLTRQLANKAKADGVSQFIYISSTKVYGDKEQGPLNELSPCIPTDAYGASKLKAEQYLQSIETETFTVAIVRPPLVYGPDVKGNMIKLLQLANKNVPLPFGKINNARSMVFVDNLIELINTIIDQQAGGVFIAGDKEPVSTTTLISLIRKSLDNKKSLFSIPPAMRKLIEKIKPALHTRLFGSFIIDNSSTNNKLHFTPPYATSEGIGKMVQWFRNGRVTQ